MLKILLIRHAKTKGNLLGCYIGRTDESLCQEGIQLLLGKSYPVAEQLYVSPMSRCIQTADLIYKNIPQKIVENLKECDFGDYENKNYMELKENTSYQSWVDSHGKLPFPNGESQECFRQRCCQAFCEILDEAFEKGYESIAIVTHGGTIMSIMECYGKPEASFYNWRVKNAGGYLLKLNEKNWTERKEICVRCSF